MPNDIFWVMRQTWRDLLFAHWRVPVDTLRAAVPEPLEIDTYEGAAWIGVVPFLMTGIRGRSMPPLPGLSRTLELNVRTYVKYRGAAGVYFFSLDAQRWAIVAGARAFYKLPYFHARMSWDGRRYESIRLDQPAAELRCEYEPLDDVRVAQPGSIESFLTDRLSLFTVSRGSVLRVDIRHGAWPLQKAGARFEMNTMATPFGFDLRGEPLLHFSKRLDVLIGTPQS